MYGFKNVVALLGGLLLLSYGVAGAAVPQTPKEETTLICAKLSPEKSPLKADCKAALAKVAPVKPEICTFQFQTEFDYVTVGTCTIHTYSTTKGRAHCLDGNLIIKGGNAILDRCSSEKYTGGQYEWETVGDLGEGVRFNRAGTTSGGSYV